MSGRGGFGGRGGPRGGYGGGGFGGRGGGPIPPGTSIRRGPIGDSGAPKPEGNAENRLYIGNMDTRMSEGTVLKLFRQFGPLKRCDYLWHTHGPKRGQPRGFCFVEFEQRKDAEKAKQHVNGKVVCGRALVVHFAEEKVHYRSDAPVEELVKTALSAGAGGRLQGEDVGAAPAIVVASNTSAIASALRQKLAQMERDND